MEDIYFNVETIMKDNIKKMKEMGQEIIILVTGIDMKVNINKANAKDMEHIILMMEENI